MPSIYCSVLQEPTLGTDLSYESTRELLISSVPLMWWSRSLPLQLNLVWKWRLPLLTLKCVALYFWLPLVSSESEVIFPHDTICLEECVKNLRRLNNGGCRVDVSLFFVILFCNLKIMFSCYVGRDFVYCPFSISNLCFDINVESLVHIKHYMLSTRRLLIIEWMEHATAAGLPKVHFFWKENLLYYCSMQLV